MKILKTLNQKENALFNRKEIEVNVETNVAPKIKEAEEFIAKEFSSVPENVKIIKVKGRFGSNNFVITARVYHSKEDRDKIEPKSKKEKAAETKSEEKKAE